MAANTQPHTSRASASVLPAAAPMARPGPRCPFRRLRLPIIRLSSRDVAGGSVARESVALLCPGAPSGGSQGPERDNQVAVVRGGLPTHLPCPLHLRAAGDQRWLGGAGELQADAPLFGHRGSVLILRSRGGGAGCRGQGRSEAVEQVLRAECDRGFVATELGGY